MDNNEDEVIEELKKKSSSRKIKRIIIGIAIILIIACGIYFAYNKFGDKIKNSFSKDNIDNSENDESLEDIPEGANIEPEFYTFENTNLMFYKTKGYYYDASFNEGIEEDVIMAAFIDSQTGNVLVFDVYSKEDSTEEDSLEGLKSFEEESIKEIYDVDFELKPMSDLQNMNGYSGEITVTEEDDEPFTLTCFVIETNNYYLDAIGFSEGETNFKDMVSTLMEV